MHLSESTRQADYATSCWKHAAITIEQLRYAEGVFSTLARGINIATIGGISNRHKALPMQYQNCDRTSAQDRTSAEFENAATAALLFCLTAFQSGEERKIRERYAKAEVLETR